MYPFPKRKKKKQKPTPTWVILLVVGFVGYTMLTDNKKAPTTTQAIQDDTVKESSTETPPAPVAPVETDKPATNPIAGLNIEPEKILGSALKGKLLPQSVMKLQVKDSAEGSGQFAVCGQKVTITYSSFNEDKKEIESKQTVSFQIGDNKVMPALEMGVVGMKKNGERSISASGHMAYGADNFTRNDVAAKANINFEVKMLEISPELPDTGAYRILGDGRSELEGYGCGSKAKLHIALWDIEGKKLYSSRDNNGSPISFTIGKSEVFLGLEQGVLEMAEGMRRNLIVPPDFQKTLLGNAPVISFPLPKNQTVLVDVESVP